MLSNSIHRPLKINCVSFPDLISYSFLLVLFRITDPFATRKVHTSKRKDSKEQKSPEQVRNLLFLCIFLFIVKRTELLQFKHPNRKIIVKLSYHLCAHSDTRFAR